MEKEFTTLQDLLENASFVRWIMEKQEEDRLIWENWLLENADKQTLVDEAIMILKGFQFNPSYPTQEKVEQELVRLHEQLQNKAVNSLPSSTKTNLLTRRSVLAFAAIFAIFAVSIFSIQTLLNNKDIQLQTAFGEKKEVKLSDGSLVSLNANSSLKYKESNPRNIWLEGEAFFNIKKAEKNKQKFWVNTKDLKVEVLGTQFNVNSRNEKTKVVLEEGEVKLSLKNGQIKTMQPGDFVTFSATASTLEEEHLEKTEMHTSWKNGVLLFKEISLQTALQKMEEVYGVQIVFQDKTIANRLVSIGLPIDDLSFCIKALEKSLNIQIEHINNQLIVK